MRYIIFILLLTYSFSYGQYIPERFAFKTRQLANNFDLVKQNYKFYTNVLTKKNNYNIDWSKEVYQIIPYDYHTHTKSIYTYVYLRPSRNLEDIFGIKIRKGTSEMYLYIRLNHYLSEGEVIFFDDFKFNEGNYFFDMCKSKPRYSSINKNTFNIESIYSKSISLKNLKKHKTSLKCIKKIVNKYNCDQTSVSKQ